MTLIGIVGHATLGRGSCQVAAKTDTSIISRESEREGGREISSRLASLSPASSSWERSLISIWGLMSNDSPSWGGVQRQPAQSTYTLQYLYTPVLGPRCSGGRPEHWRPCYHHLWSKTLLIKSRVKNIQKIIYTDQFAYSQWVNKPRIFSNRLTNYCQQSPLDDNCCIWKLLKRFTFNGTWVHR